MSRREEDFDINSIENESEFDLQDDIEETGLALNEDEERSTTRVRNSVKETLKNTKSIGWTQDIVKNALNSARPGQKQIDSNKEPTPTNGIPESGTPSVIEKSITESKIVRSMGLKEHLETLREAQSGSMNLIDSTTEHLHGLMMSVAEEAKERKDDVRAWARDNSLLVKQTIEVARQLNSSMRLKLDTVRTLHKISKDIADDK